MADREGFFSRWSRLKREGPPPEPAPEPAAEPEEAVDPASLPPIDTLDAASDYTRFLARGVSEELRRQALRRAWVSDPVIANFRGLAEYDWDFNAPGYGKLLPADDIARLCDAVFGNDLPSPPRGEGQGEGARAQLATSPAPGEVDAERRVLGEAELRPFRGSEGTAVGVLGEAELRLTPSASAVPTREVRVGPTEESLAEEVAAPPHPNPLPGGEREYCVPRRHGSALPT